MGAMQLLYVVLMVLLPSAFLHRGRFRPPAEAKLLGAPCTPDGGYLTCGDKTLLSQTVTELTEADGFDGPNLCRITSEYTVATYSYTYQRRKFFRRTYCGCTNSCTNNVNFTKTSEGCCEGFAEDENAGQEKRDSEEESYGYGRRYRRGYYRKYGRKSSKKSSLQTEGCTVELVTTSAPVTMTTTTTMTTVTTPSVATVDTDGVPEIVDPTDEVVIA